MRISKTGNSRKAYKFGLWQLFHTYCSFLEITAEIISEKKRDQIWNNTTVSHFACLLSLIEPSCWSLLPLNSIKSALAIPSLTVSPYHWRNHLGLTKNNNNLTKVAKTSGTNWMHFNNLMHLFNIINGNPTTCRIQSSKHPWTSLL